MAKENTTKQDMTKPNGEPNPDTGTKGTNEPEKVNVAGSSESFLDTLYQKITDVIGGENPNQYFCMTLPGTLIDPADYTYDVKGEKPAHVKANESKLVNKLFDACFMTASDNGKHLQNQYRTALSMLSPKLNKDLFEMKVRLREVLMTPYPYDFGDGIEDSLTLEQVFYRLYGEYVTAKAAWNQKQLDKRTELKKSIIDPNEREDAYLEWYGLVAETERVMLEERLGKVLNVFSPSDMNIINAILNCGVGGELESARSAMEMVEELSPDGGYVYPVSLSPKNWFELLDSSFTGVDLLASPAALSRQMKMLEMQRSNLLMNISRLTAAIPDDEEVNRLQKTYQEAEDSFHKLADECVKANVNATADAVRGIVALCTKKEDGKSLQTPSEAEVSRMVDSGSESDEKTKNEQVNRLINVIAENGMDCYDKQAAMTEGAGRSTDAALRWCEAHNRQQLKNLLEPLKMQLDSVNTEIAQLKEDIALSKAVMDKSNDQVADIMPNKAAEGFTQVLIQSKMSAVSEKSSRESESSSSSWGVSFFFGGYTKNKSHQQSVERSMSSSSDMEIQIGMNLAKVQIEREWFDPGVFMLTGNMYNFSHNKISADNETSFTEGDPAEVQKRFAEMNECIFPAYPVAFVIAKDVSIRFISQSTMSNTFAESIEDHASQGGGFLIFGGNSSSASDAGQSAASASSSANSVTVRFTAPQILGYYMQATPADKSIHINSTDDDTMSVIGFVSKFKEMIEEYNQSLRESR